MVKPETREERTRRHQAEKSQDMILATQIVALRAEAKSWDQIGKALDEPPARCRALMDWALKFSLGDTRQLHHMREIETETLRMMQHGLMKRALKGDVEAIREVRGLMERRAKLHGLDRPTKIAATNPDGTKEAKVAAPSLDFARLNRAERANIRKLIEKAVG